MKIEIDLNNKEHVAAIAEALRQHTEPGMESVSIYGNTDRPFVVGKWVGNYFQLGYGDTIESAKQDLANAAKEKASKEIQNLKKQLAELEGASAA